MRPFLSAASLLLLPSLAGKAQVLINEVNIAGPAEFIELFNKSSCTVDLACYTLVFSGTSGGGNPTGWTVKIPAGKSIAPCGYFLVGGLAGAAGVVGGTGYPSGGSSTSYPSADLNIGTPAITANAVYMKQGVSAGSLPNSSGQITLLDPANIIVASVSYNSGNNASTYPLSAYTTCSTLGNTQGTNNILNPGASVNNINATFSGAGLQGIYLNASNVYVTTSSFTPGSANLSQVGCAPAITASFAASPVCFGNAPQQTELSYSGTSNSPTQYNINWDITPANNFSTVTNAILPASPIVIPVPGGTLPGTYTGYLSVSNANGGSCTPVPFSVNVNPVPAVDAGNYGPLCVNGAPVTLMGLPSGGVFSGTGVSGNSFTPSAGGTYTVQYSFTDVSTGCSATTAANILVHPQPVINVSPLSPTVCQNSGGINLTASGASTYTWSPSTGLSGTAGNSVAANPSSNTVYTVTGTDANGCINLATTTVTVSPSPPVPQVTLLQPTCLTSGAIQVISPAGAGHHFSIDGINYLSNGGMYTNVAPGSYAVWVKDAAGCISSPANVVIDPLPGAPTHPAVSVQHPACGANTGTLTVTSPAGAGFSYTIDGINFQPATVFANLAPGNYTVTVKNSDGCTAAATVTIDPAPVVPPAPTVTVTNHCNGTSTLTANGATGSLLWSNGATGNPIIVSTAGAYSVTQTVNGCASSTGSGTAMPGLPPPSPSLTIVQPTCASSTGGLTITSPLGPSYVYSINGGPYTAVASYPGLHPGDYAITVQNSEGCNLSATITINLQPQTPSPPAVTITQPTCSMSTGIITVSAPPTHNYSVDGVNYTNTSGVFPNLLPGVYSVTVKNSQGCVSSATQAVVNAQPPTPMVQVNSPVICPGTTASMVATPLPAGNYQFMWAVPAGATNPGSVASFAASVAGTYSVIITNNSGCSSTASGTLSIDAFATVIAEDKQVCAGSVVALTGQPAGGVWTGTGVTGPQFDAAGLSVGNYAVTYTYTSGSCSGTATATVIVNPVPAAPVTQTIHPDCSGTGGRIMVQSPLGPDLEYSIDGVNFQSAPVFANLGAGTYPVRVRTHTGCLSALTPATINPAAGTVQSFINHCIAEGSTFLFNGQVLTTTGNYSTTYSRPALCDSTVNLYLLVTRTETQSLTGCGTYVYGGNTYFSSTSVRDTITSAVTNCDSVYRVVRIIVYPEPVTTISACLPAGQTYHFNGQVLHVSGQYTGAFLSANGCDSTVNLYLTITTVQTQDTSSCDVLFYNGVWYKSDTMLISVIPSLLTGCDSVLRRINIAVSPKPLITVSGNRKICRGDSAHLTASADNASVEWLGFGISRNITVAPSATTSYTVVATSASGCSDTAEVTIAVINFDLQLTASSNPVIAGKNAELRTTSNAAFQVLSWQPGFAGASAKYQSIVADTTMLVRVRARSREGCTDSASLLLVVDPLSDIYIPTAFTPNGDGKNDRFVVGGSSFKTFDLKVFNRWGQLVFTSAERSKGWDGRYAGKELPAGTYVYSLAALLKDGRIVRRNGTVTLIR